MSDSVKKYYENEDPTWIYESPDKGKTVTRRPFGGSVNEREPIIDEFEKKLAEQGAKNFILMGGDPTVEKVIDEFRQRSAEGIQKYGTTLHDNNLSRLEWLQHAKEEAMDLVLYLQSAIDKIKE